MDPLSDEWMEQPATDVVISLLILVVEALKKSGFDIPMVSIPMIYLSYRLFIITIPFYRAIRMLRMMLLF